MPPRWGGRRTRAGILTPCGSDKARDDQPRKPRCHGQDQRCRQRARTFAFFAVGDPSGGTRSVRVPMAVFSAPTARTGAGRSARTAKCHRCAPAGQGPARQRRYPATPAGRPCLTIGLISCAICRSAQGTGRPLGADPVQRKDGAVGILQARAIGDRNTTPVQPVMQAPGASVALALRQPVRRAIR